MKLIGLVGFAGSGKDTVGQYLVEKFGFQSLSFAESLKDTLASVFCWEREMLEGRTKESRLWREAIDPWWSEKLGIDKFTPRKAMQLVGTDLFRKHFNTDIWIMNVERKLLLLPPETNVVITDARFPNELDLIKSFRGSVTRVRRGEEPVWFETAQYAARGVSTAREAMETVYDIHESEWAWTDYQINSVIDNNSDLDDLFEKTKSLLD